MSEVGIRFYKQRELAQMERHWARVAAEVGAAVEDAFASVENSCGDGCNHCCKLRVEVLPPEAARIVDWVRENLPPKDRQQILDGIKERAAFAEDDPKTYRERSLPCVFVGERGECRVYPIRPMTCRAFGSQDVAVCSGEREDDGKSTYTATPPELAHIVATSGLFWTEFNAAMLSYWQGFPIAVKVTREEVERVMAMQAVLDASYQTRTPILVPAQQGPAEPQERPESAPDTVIGVE